MKEDTLKQLKADLTKACAEDHQFNDCIEKSQLKALAIRSFHERVLKIVGVMTAAIVIAIKKKATADAETFDINEFVLHVGDWPCDTDDYIHLPGGRIHESWYTLILELVHNNISAEMQGFKVVFAHPGKLVPTGGNAMAYSLDVKAMALVKDIEPDILGDQEGLATVGR